MVIDMVSRLYSRAMHELALNIYLRWRGKRQRGWFNSYKWIKYMNMKMTF